MDRRSRYRGALPGLAAGDALGTTVEFTTAGEFEPLTDIVGGGPFNMKPGEWTDDTSMALCLAESLIARNGFDPVHQLETYVRWFRTGHWSVKGRCFDVGNTTRDALCRFERTGEPYCGPTSPNAAGNGSLMRLAPVPLAFAHQLAEAIERAADSSRTTHAAPACVDACRYFAGLLVGAVEGRPKAEVLSSRYSPVPDLWERTRLSPEVAAVAGGTFKLKEPPAIRGSGYVVHSLEAALWAFHKADSFRDGALLAVNLGEDADTTGAVYGRIAGTYYGEEGIPDSWRTVLAMREKIEEMADRLYELVEARGRWDDGGGVGSETNASRPN
jgi:ADP-ribosyl-[dinitrogen reductase] hydrolase